MQDTESKVAHMKGFTIGMTASYDIPKQQQKKIEAFVSAYLVTYISIYSLYKIYK